MYVYLNIDFLRQSKLKDFSRIPSHDNWPKVIEKSNFGFRFALKEIRDIKYQRFWGLRWVKDLEFLLLLEMLLANIGSSEIY